MIKLTDILNKGGIFQIIIDKLSDFTETLSKKFQEDYLVKHSKLPTELDIEDFKLDISYNLLKTLESYILPTDELIEIIFNYQNTIEVTIIINRDGENYYLTTDMVLAGGHNIQSLHYRYLTKTKLPKINKDFLNKQKQDLKTKKNNEKIEKEISKKQEKIIRLQNKINTNKNKIGMGSEEEILNLLIKTKQIYIPETWENLSQYWKDYHKNEVEYLKNMEELHKQQISFWEMINLENPTEEIKNLEKEIDRLKSKLI
jgi:hypothetical protein